MDLWSTYNADFIFSASASRPLKPAAPMLWGENREGRCNASHCWMSWLLLSLHTDIYCIITPLVLQLVWIEDTIPELSSAANDRREGERRTFVRAKMQHARLHVCQEDGCWRACMLAHPPRNHDLVISACTVEQRCKYFPSVLES